MKAEHGVALQALRNENFELAQEITELTSSGVLALSDEEEADEEKVDQLAGLESNDVQYLRRLAHELGAESKDRAESLTAEKRRYESLEAEFAELQVGQRGRGGGGRGG